MRLHLVTERAPGAPIMIALCIGCLVAIRVHCQWQRVGGGISTPRCANGVARPSADRHLGAIDVNPGSQIEYILAPVCAMTGRAIH